MRLINILVTFMVTSAIASVMYLSQEFRNSSKLDNTYYTDIAASRDAELLQQFLASLDPKIMLDYAEKHDAGQQVDLDYLAQCGDFETYARYMRVSKFEAVKKFEYVLLHSSSQLEFEDRLAR